MAQLTPARSGEPVHGVRSGASAVLTGARRGHPGLFLLAVGSLGLAVASAAGLVVDDRVLLGAPLWLKPLKFALSSGSTRSRWPGCSRWSTAGDAPVQHTVGRHGRLGRRTGDHRRQAARGVRSHFNEDTDWDATLFSVMGMTVAVIWLATVGWPSGCCADPASTRRSTPRSGSGCWWPCSGCWSGW
jgi:hypothetical protein